MRRVALLLVVSIGFLASATPSKAAFVTEFVGNSVLSPNPIAGGWVNFAVYDTYASGTNWITDLGLTGEVTNYLLPQAVTGTERFAFFYQVMRDSTTDNQSDITFARVDTLFGAVWSGVGALNGWVFNDADDGATGPSGTILTGLDAVSPFVTDGDAALVAFADITAGGSRGRVQSFNPPLLENEFSSILILTSNAGPRLGGVLGTGFGEDPGPTALVPVAVPEPGSLILLGLAMVVGGAGFGWKRRQQKIQEALCSVKS